MQSHFCVSDSRLRMRWSKNSVCHDTRRFLAVYRFQFSTIFFMSREEENTVNMWM